MLSIIFQRGFFGFKCNFLGYVHRFHVDGSVFHHSPQIPSTSSCISRNFKIDNNPLLPGGGLEKLQGGFKEEKYFNLHESELISKLREQYSKGTKLKCENCYGNWAEFEKMLTAKEPTAIRESCCLNKHKNCMEEAFFFNEQSENMQLFQKKMADERSLTRPLDPTHSKSNL